MAGEGHTGLGNQREVIKNSTLETLTKESISEWDGAKSDSLNMKDSLKTISSGAGDISSKWGGFSVPNIKDKLSSLAGSAKDYLKANLPIDIKAIKDAMNLDGRLDMFKSGLSDLKGLLASIPLAKNGGGILDGILNLDPETLAKVGRFIATNPEILTKKGLTNFIKDQGKATANDLIKKLGLPKNLIDCLTNNMLNEASFGNNSFGGHNITMRSLIDKFLAKNKCAKAAAMDLDPTYFGNRNGTGPGGFLTQLANSALLNTMINGDPKNAEYWFRAAMALHDNKPYLLKGVSQSLYNREYTYTKLHMFSSSYIRPNGQSIITPKERALVHIPSQIVINNIYFSPEDKKDPNKTVETIVGGLSVIDDKWNKDDNDEICYSKFKENEEVAEMVNLALITGSSNKLDITATPALQTNSFLISLDFEKKQKLTSAILTMAPKEKQAFIELVNLKPKVKEGYKYNGPLGYHINLPEEPANELNKDIVGDMKIQYTKISDGSIKHTVDMTSLLKYAYDDPELMRILTGNVYLIKEDNTYKLCPEQATAIVTLFNIPDVKINRNQKAKLQELLDLEIVEGGEAKEQLVPIQYFTAKEEIAIQDKLSYMVSLSDEQKLYVLSMILVMKPSEIIDLNKTYNDIDLSGKYITVIEPKHAIKLVSLSSGELPKHLRSTSA